MRTAEAIAHDFHTHGSIFDFNFQVFFVLFVLYAIIATMHVFTKGKEGK